MPNPHLHVRWFDPAKWVIHVNVWSFSYNITNDQCPDVPSRKMSLLLKHKNPSCFCGFNYIHIGQRNMRFLEHNDPWEPHICTCLKLITSLYFVFGGDLLECTMLWISWAFKFLIQNSSDSYFIWCFPPQSCYRPQSISRSYFQDIVYHAAVPCVSNHVYLLSQGKATQIQIQRHPGPTHNLNRDVKILFHVYIVVRV